MNSKRFTLIYIIIKHKKTQNVESNKTEATHHIQGNFKKINSLFLIGNHISQKVVGSHTMLKNKTETNKQTKIEY